MPLVLLKLGGSVLNATTTKPWVTSNQTIPSAEVAICDGEYGVHVHLALFGPRGVVGASERRRWGLLSH
jgi:hypothetical protein